MASVKIRAKKNSVSSKNKQAVQTAADTEERKNPVTVEQTADGRFVFHGRSLRPSKDKSEALFPHGKMLHDFGLKLMLFPSSGQEQQIRRTIGCARFVRNDYLSTRKEQFTRERSTLSVSDYKKGRLAALKEEHPWLSDVDKFALESAIEHVEDSYQNFFSGRSRFPKFAGKYTTSGSRYTTKQTNDNIALVEENGQLFVKLPKTGKVPAVLPRGMKLSDIMTKNARILNATVELDGKNIMAALCIEDVVDLVSSIKTYDPARVISMDMGIHRFCDYSDGNSTYERVDNPGWIKKHAKRLARLQRSMSRKRYDRTTHSGSKNWRKARLLVSREQRKVKNQRLDFHHKLSRKIAQICDVFICEDLNIRGMLKNRHLSKAISSVGWYQFLTFVKYKVEAQGGRFIKVSRWFPSSKLCTCCGYKNADLELNDRYWICPSCHKFNDRDDNAVDNLRTEGLRMLMEQGITAIT